MASISILLTTVNLVKSGTGTWTLGPNITATFSGPVSVSAGNLVLGANLGLNVTGAANVTAGTLTVTANSGDSTAGELGNNTAAGAITIAQGATLDASSFTLYKLQPAQRLINGGTFKTGGTLERFGDNTIVVGSDGGAGTFNLTGNLQLTNQFAPSPNTNGLKFDLGNTTTVGGGVNDVLAVSGNISVDSSSGQIPIIVNPLNGALATGTYELMTYGGSLTGSSTDFSISGASSGTTRQSFTIDTSHLGHIDLDVTGAPASLVWKGDGSGNSWDVVTTPNWKNGAANDNFFNFDQVTFNDTTANTTVNLNATVIPGSISVNTAQTYLVQGSGTITGGATLTKSGTGTFILANTGTNDFNGGDHHQRRHATDRKRRHRRQHRARARSPTAARWSSTNPSRSRSPMPSPARARWFSTVPADWC